MSYGIELYRPEFLRRAIAEDLGDWTNPDPIASADRYAIARRLQAKGYVEEHAEHQLGRSFRHPDERFGIQVSIHRGSVSFSVPYWDDSADAIATALEHARELAESFALAIHDSQTGQNKGSP